MLKIVAAATAACFVASVAAVPSDPKAAAAALIAKMTLDEKVTLLHGGRAPGQAGYVGNTPPIERLGIPALNLNDGPQGFRSGGTTCWPSGLTVATTWDVDAMGAWGEAMGGEFFGKGANVQLGPGVCVARVPKCGRNFEYLSGEDPYLGFRLVQPVIRGIQSKGVIANAKHWVNNNQETDRSGGNEVVDERTRWEMYYPPFLGAIKAEVGSIMCSYNRINGNYSCGNNETLNTDYKVRAGFEGWVMSDWGATHSMSINRGLDQEMPGGGHMGLPLKMAVGSGEVSMAKVDDSVSRILTQMYKFGLFDHVAQWNGTAHGNDVTSPANSQLARDLAANATVLLKNDGVLPLKPGQKVLLVGNDATSPFVHGGGSGSVEPTYTVSPLRAITTRNGGTVPKSGGGGGAPLNCTVLDQDTDYFSSPGSKPVGHKDSVTDCCTACGTTGGNYNYFTRTNSGDCWCHQQVGQKRTGKAGFVSGSCHTVAPAPAPGPASNSVSTCSKDCGAAAAAADVAVVFIHVTSSEGSDRKTLGFSDDDNAMVAEVAKAQKNTVVVMVNPGAVLTPWAGDVGALLTMFMPGLEMGNAVSDILYGDVNPSGRLALTFPNIENELNFSKSQWPGLPVATGLESTYSEKLEVGYRYYDAHKIEPKFAFGHGLSYAKFGYSGLSVKGLNISFTLKNSGSVAGAEVAQLYLGFPASAGEPPQQLKSFEKVSLAPGASASVTFALSAGDLAVWDAQAHEWAGVKGTFSLFVGASSRDIKLTGSLEHTPTPGVKVEAWK